MFFRWETLIGRSDNVILEVQEIWIVYIFMVIMRCNIGRFWCSFFFFCFLELYFWPFPKRHQLFVKSSSKEYSNMPLEWDGAHLTVSKVLLYSGWIYTFFFSVFPSWFSRTYRKTSSDGGDVFRFVVSDLFVSEELGFHYDSRGPKIQV